MRPVTNADQVISFQVRGYKNENGCQEAQVKAAHGGSQCKDEPRTGEAETIKHWRGKEHRSHLTRRQWQWYSLL